MELLNWVGDLVWGPPMLLLLVGTGVFLTFRLRGLQFTKLWYAHKLIFTKDQKSEGDISHFQALTTALAATIGTGNIAGVATAIFLGGPGAVFWMWMTGLVGMATKYSEAILAVKYRVTDSRGEMCGGPMYYIERGLGWKWLGVLFAFFGAAAAFGIGNMVQSNSVAAAVTSTFSVSPTITGIVLAVLTALVVLGGIKSIGRVTAYLVPFMAAIYVAGGLIVVLINVAEIPAAFGAIFAGAFGGEAAFGGAVGAAIRYGVARGVFSNEAGLGSAPIAAAAARTDYPGRQALVSMTQTFIDTIVVCTITALAILTSGALATGETGAALTTAAFNVGLPGTGGIIVAIGIILFAYSTILGWCYYGEKCMEYLISEKAVIYYRVVFVLFVFVGAVAKLDFVWTFSDVMNGLMAVPNLIGLLLLSGVVVAETRHFLEKTSAERK
ncbi:alanine/glycine:cation symporter family protein [Pelovirga terrestris]|uniref:Sodium:alanine symporter family protein n=1 Tax=Pelovirga terrestris TaxID=2771352 RepID=A0A8J6QP55_9BACT|nr:sodium:alanine symporter family protein [Pelovirga terrestris]MBD1401452.1 sodium:alanine symporter family protein [Pelovirga terrestris]